VHILRVNPEYNMKRLATLILKFSTTSVRWQIREMSEYRGNSTIINENDIDIIDYFKKFVPHNLNITVSNRVYGMDGIV
jgi:hypothetical protein